MLAVECIVHMYSTRVRVQALQVDLSTLRRRERSARVEAAQLRAKLAALDDFAGDQFEASLCATPSCNTLGMSVHGDESSVAGLLPNACYVN